MPNHPGSIDKHGVRWRIRLSVGGKRHLFFLDGSTSLEDVEQHAREKHTELHRRNGRGLPGPMAFSELVDRYRETRFQDLAANSQKGYDSSLKAFERFFVNEGGNPAVHQVGKGDVNAFLAWRKLHAPDGASLPKPLSAKSLAKERVILHVLLAFAEALEIVESNPVSKVDKPRGDSRQPVILTTDQYEALLGECEQNPMLFAYVLTLGEAGLRCDSEALWLRWEDIDLERGFLTIESGRNGHRTKSGKSRKVPMTPRLADAMREHMASYRLRTYHGQRTPWVFHHEMTWRHSKAGERIARFRASFDAAAKRAGLPDTFKQHDLRHTRVTEWLRLGHPAHKVQLAMGHQDLKTTLGYAHLVADDLLSLVEGPEQQLRALAGR